jgi:phospholipid transport system transporter-binding protein
MMTQEGDRFVIRGSLNMQTVPSLFNQGLQQLAKGDLRVDFSQVEVVDSATVSMLLGWLRAAQAKQHALIVQSLPQNLLSLATLYGVVDLLPTYE